jgi:hypothetical protein
MVTACQPTSRSRFRNGTRPPSGPETVTLVLQLDLPLGFSRRNNVITASGSPGLRAQDAVGPHDIDIRMNTLEPLADKPGYVVIVRNKHSYNKTFHTHSDQFRARICTIPTTSSPFRWFLIGINGQTGCRCFRGLTYEIPDPAMCGQKPGRGFSEREGWNTSGDGIGRRCFTVERADYRVRRDGRTQQKSSHQGHNDRSDDNANLPHNASPSRLISTATLPS